MPRNHQMKKLCAKSLDAVKFPNNLFKQQIAPGRIVFQCRQTRKNGMACKRFHKGYGIRFRAWKEDSAKKKIQQKIKEDSLNPPKTRE